MFYRRAALAVALALAAAAAAPAAAQTTTFTFDAVPNATAAGAFTTASGYAFTNFSTLDAPSLFGTGNNAVGGTGRFAYVPLRQGFGSVRRETFDFFFGSAFLSFRAFDAVTTPISLTINGYRGFDPAADPVFTRTLSLTSTAQFFDFGNVTLSEVEFLTDNFEVGGRQAVLAMDNLVLTSVPEPGTVALVAAGGLVLGAVRLRRRPAA